MPLRYIVRTKIACTWAPTRSWVHETRFPFVGAEVLVTLILSPATAAVALIDSSLYSTGGISIKISHIKETNIAMQATRITANVLTFFVLINFRTVINTKTETLTANTNPIPIHHTDQLHDLVTIIKTIFVTNDVPSVIRQEQIKNVYKSRISSLYNVTKVRPISTIPCKKANLIISHVLYPSRVKSTPTSPGMDVLEFFRICSFLCEFITDLISWYSSLDMWTGSSVFCCSSLPSYISSTVVCLSSSSVANLLSMLAVVDVLSFFCFSASSPPPFFCGLSSILTVISSTFFIWTISLSVSSLCTLKSLPNRCLFGTLSTISIVLVRAPRFFS